LLCQEARGWAKNYDDGPAVSSHPLRAINFTLETDLREQSRCHFAAMGAEVNGKDYEVQKG